MSSVCSVIFEYKYDTIFAKIFFSFFLYVNYIQIILILTLSVENNNLNLISSSSQVLFCIQLTYRFFVCLSKEN